MRLRSIGLIAVVALLVAGCAAGGANEAAGPSEGITLHGHWTIDVLNDDGSHDRTIEFENSLFEFGASQLAEILAGTITPGELLIGLTSVDLVIPNEVGADTSCASTDGGCRIPTSNIELVDVVGQSGLETVRVTAQTGAIVGGEITSVFTSFGTCPGETAPSDCGTGPVGNSRFTSKSLDTPEAVLDGQLIQIQVDLRFDFPLP